MADPANVFALDDIRLTRHEPVAMLAIAAQIEEAMGKVFGAHDNERCSASCTKSSRMSPPRQSCAPVVQFVNQLIMRAINERASDLHIEPSHQPTLR